MTSSPGPGTYAHQTDFGVDGRGSTMTPRRQQIKTDMMPGPGSYDVSQADLNRSPGYTYTIILPSWSNL